MRKIALLLLVAASFLMVSCLPSLAEATQFAEQTKHAAQTLFADEATLEAIETEAAAPRVTAEAGTAQALATAAILRMTPTATFDPSSEGSISIEAGDCTITFLGDFEAVQGEKLVLRFRVDCDGVPGQGKFFATLGDPPSDAKATHGNGDLDAEGKITLELDVNWDPGETVLYVSFEGKVYPVVFDFPVAAN